MSGLSISIVGVCLFRGRLNFSEGHERGYQLVSLSRGRNLWVSSAALGIPLFLESLANWEAGKLSRSLSLNLSCPPSFLMTNTPPVLSYRPLIPGWVAFQCASTGGGLSFKGQGCPSNSILHHLVGHFTSSSDVRSSRRFLGGRRGRGSALGEGRGSPARSALRALSRALSSEPCNPSREQWADWTRKSPRFLPP